MRRRGGYLLVEQQRGALVRRRYAHADEASGGRLPPAGRVRPCNSPTSRLSRTGRWRGSASHAGARAARRSFLRKFGQVLAAARAAGLAPPPVSVPVGYTTFPGELWAAPRSWVETVYPSLTYFNEVDRGGHFAAREEPELFSAELRAAFSSLR